MVSSLPRLKTLLFAFPDKLGTTPDHGPKTQRMLRGFRLIIPCAGDTS